MLVVSALKLGNPMVFGVDMVADNFSLHTGRESIAPVPLSGRRRCVGADRGVETSRQVQSESLRAPAQEQNRPRSMCTRGR